MLFLLFGCTLRKILFLYVCFSAVRLKGINSQTGKTHLKKKKYFIFFSSYFSRHYVTKDWSQVTLIIFMLFMTKFTNRHYLLQIQIYLNKMLLPDQIRMLKTELFFFNKISPPSSFVDSKFYLFHNIFLLSNHCNINKTN